MKFTAERLTIVALLVFIAILSFRSCMRSNDKVQAIKTVVLRKGDTIKRYKDAAGREHGARVEAEGSISTIRAIYADELDSLRAALGVREEQIKSFQAIGTRTEGNVKLNVKEIQRDSTKVQQFAYSDAWLQIEGEISDKPALHYSFKDSLTVSTYTKRKWLLGRKTTYIDAYSQNPAVKITGINGVRVAKSEPGRFGIGPFVGVGYNGREWAPAVGVALQYSIIRF